jgi:hypothetical protein
VLVSGEGGGVVFGARGEVWVAVSGNRRSDHWLEGDPGRGSVHCSRARTPEQAGQRP